MTGMLRRVVLTLLLVSAVGVNVSGCLLVPFPVGGGHGHGRHDHRHRW